jgi:hypothetical protein
MGKIIKAQAKHNCTVYYSGVPFGYSHSKKGVVAGQVIELEMVSSEKISDRTIASILGDRNVILKDGDNFVSTYSGDFVYSENKS